MKANRVDTIMYGKLSNPVSRIKQLDEKVLYTIKHLIKTNDEANMKSKGRKSKEERKLSRAPRCPAATNDSQQSSINPEFLNQNRSLCPLIWF